jgi:hypothetical protein
VPGVRLVNLFQQKRSGSSESEANQADPSTAVKAVRWPKAFDAARQAGFSKLGDVGEAHFEIRLERHTA